ncbi:MAG: DNA translocase FtsK [Candidatus Nomurabacteria bacterium]|nr:DNA translocase FtsK [Candidatus Nomurabacteria bacterium]
MAKKKKRSFSWKPNMEIADGTRRGILAVLFFVLSVFFILASLGYAGNIGTTIFDFVIFPGFGYGFIILPILLITLGVMMIKDSLPEVTAKQWVSSVFLILASLGLMETIWGGKGFGGVVGLIARPIERGLDTPFTIILLFGIIVVSILIMLETSLGIPNFISSLFSKKEEEEDEEYYEEEDEYEDELEEEYEDEPEPTIASRGMNILGIGKSKKKPEKDVLEIQTPTYSLPSTYTPPPLSLLAKDKGKPEVGDIKANATTIQRTLENFGISVEMDEISVGPTVTRFALKPAQGVKLSKILSLQNELALALAAHPVRIEAPIPGTSLVGIEVPNKHKVKVHLGPLLASPEWKNNPSSLLAALGKGVSGNIFTKSISSMPHLLIAGATGAGKSVTVHGIIMSMLFRHGPEDLRFIMVDPKRVELTQYNKIPHLLTPVIKEPKKAILALKWAVKEMERRYNVLEESSVRDIDSYHENIVKPAYDDFDEESEDNDDLPERMPYIVVIIDELADIMSAYPRELESGIVRLAQMSRAVGIHLILSTQRPSVNVITGLIKANIPARIALRVASQIDSRTILDSAGAEKLIGHGDMLFSGGEMSKPARMQSPFISEDEMRSVVNFIIKNNMEDLPDEINLTGDDGPETTIFDVDIDIDDEDEDDLYEDAKMTVIKAGKASTSYLQRRLKIGYSRAARIMDMLEERGVIGRQEGSKPREILSNEDNGDAEYEEPEDSQEYEDEDEDE